MTKHRISDEDASAILRGQTPEAREDLRDLADSVTMFRLAAQVTSARPSAELTQWLEGEQADTISTTADGLPRAKPVGAKTAEQSGPRVGRARVLVSGFVGLGLAAKIAIGATAAAAVGISGAGVAGAAGVLPPAAQQAYDQVLGIEKPAEEVTLSEEDVVDGETNEGTDEESTVVHPGKNASETGVENSQFGQETAEEARQRGEERRQAGQESGDEGDDTDDESAGPGTGGPGTGEENRGGARR